MKIAGWIMSGLLVAFLVLVSGIPKFIEWEGRDEMFEKMGFTVSLVQKIGVVEIVLALLFLVPRAAFLAAILLTAYLGGATLTHVRAGEDFYFPILTGIFMWIALGLRQPDIFSLAIGAPIKRSTAGEIEQG